ncbi:hypothetical protein V6N13_092982 [Hibiscus sabdariffa]|uniref:Uncharacterized protein n=2 Tax=Hibiscus sabdariffa TaxID=183260 RepID=A0ABR2NQY7_9ROSI
MKEVEYKQKWGEVAPSPLINPTKSSTCPSLDTILEEGMWLSVLEKISEKDNGGICEDDPSMLWLSLLERWKSFELIIRRSLEKMEEFNKFNAEEERLLFNKFMAL